jgi:hypothetical protein
MSASASPTRPDQATGVGAKVDEGVCSFWRLHDSTCAVLGSPGSAAALHQRQDPEPWFLSDQERREEASLAAAIAVECVRLGGWMIAAVFANARCIGKVAICRSICQPRKGGAASPRFATGGSGRAK